MGCMPVIPKLLHHAAAHSMCTLLAVLLHHAPVLQVLLMGCAPVLSPLLLAVVYPPCWSQHVQSSRRMCGRVHLRCWEIWPKHAQGESVHRRSCGYIDCVVTPLGKGTMCGCLHF
jgi:hypothetical protein